MRSKCDNGKEKPHNDRPCTKKFNIKAIDHELKQFNKGNHQSFNVPELEKYKSFKTRDLIEGFTEDRTGYNLEHTNNLILNLNNFCQKNSPHHLFPQFVRPNGQRSTLL